MVMKYIQFWNFWDSASSVWGLALVRRGFEAYLHRHEEDETYYVLWGTARLSVGGETNTVCAPHRRHIPGNSLHAMTPVSCFVLLLYRFPKGPHNTIEYTFTEEKI